VQDRRHEFITVNSFGHKAAAVCDNYLQELHDTMQ